jgi:hypothetical protein
MFGKKNNAEMKAVAKDMDGEKDMGGLRGAKKRKKKTRKKGGRK